MKYIFFIHENDKYWIEINDKKIAVRQIILSNNQYHISCFEDCLAEGKIIKSQIDAEIIEISNKDFEIIWYSILEEHRSEWIRLKKKYTINSTIKGTFMYLYPQGAIFKNGRILINYKGKKEVKLHSELEMIIVGYDEKNMWLITE